LSPVRHWRRDEQSTSGIPTVDHAPAGCAQPLRSTRATSGDWSASVCHDRSSTKPGLVVHPVLRRLPRRERGPARLRQRYAGATRRPRRRWRRPGFRAVRTCNRFRGRSCVRRPRRLVRPAGVRPAQHGIVPAARRRDSGHPGRHRPELSGTSHPSAAVDNADRAADPGTVQRSRRRRFTRRGDRFRGGGDHQPGHDVRGHHCRWPYGLAGCVRTRLH